MKKILIIPCAMLIITFIVMASAQENYKGITGTCYEEEHGQNPVENCSTMLCYKPNYYACTTKADEYGEYTVDLSLPTCNPPGPEAGAYDIKAWKHINGFLYTDNNGYADFDPDGDTLLPNDFVLEAEPDE